VRPRLRLSRSVSEPCRVTDRRRRREATAALGWMRLWHCHPALSPGTVARHCRPALSPATSNDRAGGTTAARSKERSRESAPRWSFASVYWPCGLRLGRTPAGSLSLSSSEHRGDGEVGPVDGCSVIICATSQTPTLREPPRSSVFASRSISTPPGRSQWNFPAEHSRSTFSSRHQDQVFDGRTIVRPPTAMTHGRSSCS